MGSTLSFHSFALVALLFLDLFSTMALSIESKNIHLERGVEKYATPLDNTGAWWAGADIDTVARTRALPGRIFYDFDGKTVKDPIQILGDAGVNAFRLETARGQCLGPKPFNDSGTLGDELLFKLDFGCIDIKVKTAKQAIALGMRMQLTINQGLDIPPGMEKYSYAEMVEEVKKETKRQLQPFLDAKIVPDVILFENEGSDGFLFRETATGHERGTKDDKVSEETTDKEKCGQIPTGKLVGSYPQLAGYYKAEVVACNEAIKEAGFSIDTVRYGLHSHGQYVQWKESVVHGPNRASQIKLAKSNGSPCDGPSPIPADLLAMDAAEMLTVAGFSAYPDPMRPADINSTSSQLATLSRFNDTLTQLQGYSHIYGKYTSGPFRGQNKLQALGVEYATQYQWPEEIPQQQAHTELMWKTAKKFSATFMGMMWWEPTYFVNDWEGGQATLWHHVGNDGGAPTDTLKTWGKAAVSPWKAERVGSKGIE